MALIDKHAPGSFCWIELGTSDQNAAKNFYGALFGWAAQDIPMGPNDFYTMFQLEGRNAAAAYTLRPGQRSQGVPPHWMIYVAAENADESAKRTAQAGGQVLAPAFDVFDVGRMAVLQDPTGAVFSVWQPKSHSGIGIAAVDGTLCWVDLSTPDAERAKRFYTDVFGWRITSGENDSSGYLHIQNGEQFIGGIQPPAHRNPSAPPHWLAYFLAADCDVSTAKAKDLGANVLMPSMTMENVGRWSVVADPQGAVFAIFQAAPRGSEPR
jgi:uncharacterized protein